MAWSRFFCALRKGRRCPCAARLIVVPALISFLTRCSVCSFITISFIQSSSILSWSTEIYCLQRSFHVSSTNEINISKVFILRALRVLLVRLWLMSVYGRWSLESSGSLVFERKLGCFTDQQGAWADRLVECNREIFFLTGKMKFSLPFYRLVHFFYSHQLKLNFCKLLITCNWSLWIRTA